MQFHLPEIGSWGEEKYRLVRNYAQIFATSMKGLNGNAGFISIYLPELDARKSRTPVKLLMDRH